ncbi:MAG: hypothetical protein KGO53_00965 [Alphaproteobacteria bacterium]|nr:hypothetical protein [Alphaproteobacteria bacterium]
MRRLRAVLAGQLGQFGEDQSGLALIYVTMALPVIIGFALLAIDFSRFATLQSSLQNGVDALALAGAAELDHQPDAIDRANRAMTNLLTTNKSLFATTVTTINSAAVGTPCFMTALPPSDTTKIGPGTSYACLDTSQASAAKTANYVSLTVTPQSFATIFPPEFIQAVSGTTSTQARAVAGLKQAACNFTPLFICNPNEPTSGSNTGDDYGFSSVAETGKIIALKQHTSSSQWSPGNYGFLQPNAGPGAHTLKQMIAEATPSACFILNGLYTQTGNITSAADAFNTRFDLYTGSFGQTSDHTNYPPAANVRKGYVVKKSSGNGNASPCNDNNPITAFFGSKNGNANYDMAMGLAHDSVIDPNTRIGNGDWGGDTPSTDVLTTDFKEYWKANFNGIAIPRDANGVSYSNTHLPSRYDIYQYEINNNLVTHVGAGNGLTGNNNIPGETGAPVCAAGLGVSNPDRRIIYAAIINCGAAALGNGSSGGPYVAAEFGKFFMTEPMGSDNVLYTELVSVVKPGQADSVIRDIVQLYR